MNTSLTAQDRLTAGGVKPSLQRIAILDFLMKHPIHPTVDTIFNELYPLIPTLSRTTVYNTLKLLSEQKVIRALLIDEKNVRYDADTTRHAHFKCKKCGCIADISIRGLEHIEPLATDDVLITGCELYYTGYCADCKTEIG